MPVSLRTLLRFPSPASVPRALACLAAAALAACANDAPPAPTALGGAAAVRTPAGVRVPNEDITINVGHRGASGRAPEHTLYAYDLALSLGADYIEQDLQLTKDGVLVVLHDATLDRTATGPARNCTGLVIEKTLAQLKTCEVGRWFNRAYPLYARPEYVGMRIPTLEEVFQRYGKRVNYYIETKNPEDAPGMEEALLSLMDAYVLRDRAIEHRQVLIQSFSPASLQKIHQLEPRLPLIQLYGTPVDTSAFAEIASYAVGLGPSKGLVTAAVTAAAHAQCLDVHPYTVNDPAEMRKLLDLGVDGMFTNFPERLDAVLADSALVAKVAVRGAAKAGERCRNRQG
jgi:glycerophosphoryl diester phosphodiesterase